MLKISGRLWTTLIHMKICHCLRPNLISIMVKSKFEVEYESPSEIYCILGIFLFFFSFNYR